jgi:sulfatase modifying factor 1
MIARLTQEQGHADGGSALTIVDPKLSGLADAQVMLSISKPMKGVGEIFLDPRRADGWSESPCRFKPIKAGSQGQNQWIIELSPALTQQFMNNASYRLRIYDGIGLKGDYRFAAPRTIRRPTRPPNGWQSGEVAETYNPDAGSDHPAAGAVGGGPGRGAGLEAESNAGRMGGIASGVTESGPDPNPADGAGRSRSWMPWAVAGSVIAALLLLAIAIIFWRSDDPAVPQTATAQPDQTQRPDPRTPEPPRAEPERSVLADGNSEPARPRIVDPPPSPGPGPAAPVPTFRDCDICPEMVVIPGGQFVMGSDRDEDASENIPQQFQNRSQPQRTVRVESFSAGRYEVTRAEYRAFVQDTGRPTVGGCEVWSGERFVNDPGKNWRDPGFAQNDRHPVTCVSWQDATDYANWLSRRTGKPYRLLSEAEWEYAARAGTRSRRFWGDDARGSCDFANGADRSAADRVSGFRKLNTFVECDDRNPWTSRVGSYRGNAFGLHDMLGNVSEWVSDCWTENYKHAPADASSRTGGDCAKRVLRGGPWSYGPGYLRSAFRFERDAHVRSDHEGFRVARSN